MSAALKQQSEPSPRAALRRAIVERRAISERLDALAMAADKAMERQRSTTAMLSNTDETAAINWALWSEDQSRPRPIDATQRRNELQAHAAAATRAADVAMRARAEGEEFAAAEMRSTNAAIDSAITQILLDEAAKLGGEYLGSIRSALHAEAALNGIRAHFARAKDGANVALVQQALQGSSPAEAERMRKATLRHTAGLQGRWALYADKLREDPDLVEDLA
jgi:hypothetical protein